MCADESYYSPNVFYRLGPPLRTLKVTLSFPAKDTCVKTGCALSLIIMLVLARRWFCLQMLQHLEMLFIFTKRLKVSMICGSQNMNRIMKYDILVLDLCKLRYCLIINLLSSRKVRVPYIPCPIQSSGVAHIVSSLSGTPGKLTSKIPLGSHSLPRIKMPNRIRTNQTLLTINARVLNFKR